MRRPHTQLALLFAWLLLLDVSPLLLVGPGCASSPRAIAFKTLSSVAHTVDAAMVAYADRVVAGKVDAATQAKVRDLKLRYEKAFLIAATAAQANLESATPTELANIAAALVEAATGRTL